jgi:hypothetical protein
VDKLTTSIYTQQLLLVIHFLSSEMPAQTPAAPNLSGIWKGDLAGVGCTASGFTLSLGHQNAADKRAGKGLAAAWDHLTRSAIRIQSRYRARDRIPERLRLRNDVGSCATSKRNGVYRQ